MVKLRKIKNYALEQIKHHYYVISTNGLGVSNKTRTEWDQKWRTNTNMKMLLVAPKDYAGSFYRWAKAVNDYSPDVSCRAISLFKHRYNYEYDCIFHSFASGFQKQKDVQRLVDEADGLHLKDEFFFYNTHRSPSISRFILSLIEEFQKKNKPVLFTHYGSLARRFQSEPAYRQVVSSFDARIALTPDLNYDWFNGYFVPHTIDLNLFPYVWSQSKIFAHSPSSRLIKGSDAMLSALHRIEEIQRQWTIDIIENVRYDKCLDRKSKAELFFDQAGRVETDRIDGNEIIGWYGNSAVEAMAFGIPTISHISDSAFQQSKNAGKDIKTACPILNTELDETSMEKAILNYLHLSSDDQKKLSQKTRRWVEEFHSENVVGKELGNIYKNCIQKLK